MMACNTDGFVVLFCTLIVISTYHEARGHVVLTYPPARKYALDFLDNIRTRGPCGIPKGLGPVTNLTIGSSFNITWHVAYPHKGGYQLNLLDENDRPIYNITQRSTNSPFVNSNDPTRLHHEIVVPNIQCTNCSIQLIRLAGEWGAGPVCGPDYLFWSCADVNLVPNQAGEDLCNGHPYENGSCVCSKPYTGSRCQYKEDCFQDSDCGNHGECIHTNATYYPKNQCYCDLGWFGRNCEKKSPVNSTDIDFSLYTSTNVSNEYQLSYRVLLIESEIEVVLRVKTATWVGLGWRPSGFQSGCQLFPALPGDVSNGPTAEPEPEKSTAEPEPGKSTAEPEPEKSTAEPEPEKSTAEPEPEKSTAEPEPEKSTAEPEPEKSTAEPEPEKSTAEPEPEKSTAEPEPEKSTAEPEPEKSTAEPEPKKTTAEPESTPQYSCTNVLTFCQGPSCVYYAKIEYNATVLNIQLSATVASTEWVGIGFSSSQSMNDSDIYTAYMDTQGNIIVDDRYHAEIWTQASSHRVTNQDSISAGLVHHDLLHSLKNVGAYKVMPSKDDTQNVEFVTGSYDNGRLSATFYRERDTMDRNQDALLTNYQCFYIIMAWRGNADASGNLGYHGSNRNVTQKEVCFGPCSSTVSPEPTSEPESTPEPKTTPEPEDEPVCGGTWKKCLSGPDMCDYEAEWTYDQLIDTVTFTVRAKVAENEWFAIGFSNDMIMPNSDVYFGAYDNGKIVVTDRYAQARSLPVKDTSQNHFNVSGTRVDGRSTMTFSRKRNTTDVQSDFTFTDSDCAYFLFAWGGSYNNMMNIDLGGIHKHRFISQEKICIKACDPISPEPKKSTTVPEPEKSTSAEPEPEKSTAEPEPEKSTSAEPEPEKSTAEPEPEKSTAEPEPEKSTAEPEPEKSTAEPEPGQSTAEPEPDGGNNGCGGRPAGTSDTTGNLLQNGMDCTDIVVATARGMRSRIGDYYTRGRSTPQHDEFYGGSQSLTAAFGFEEEGYTTVLFRKKLQASERTDHSIVNSFMHVIWARGQDAGNYVHRPPTGIDGANTASDPEYYKVDELKYHGHNTHRGIVRVNFLQGQTYAPTRLVEVTIKLLGLPWYSFYEDKTSAEFINLHKDMSDGLTQYLGVNLAGFIRIRNITFSSGSIMVHFGIVFENNKNAVDTALNNLVKTEQNLHGYTLDPQVLQVSQPVPYTETDPVATTPTPPRLCEGTWGSCGTQDSSCHMVKWSYNDSTNLITFTIKAYLENNQWTAVGFSQNSQMAMTDIVLGYVKGDGNSTVLEDRWAGPNYGAPAKDTSNDVTLVTSSRENKVTTLVFTRPPTTSEPDTDHQFTASNCAYFIYAKGGTFSSSGSITKHDLIPIISTEKVCIPCPKPATTVAPGTNTSRTVPTPTPAPTAPVYVIKAEFKILGHLWIGEHGDRNSPAFKSLERDLLKPLTDLFSKRVMGFDRVVINSFRPGSIVVDFGILYRTLDQGATQTVAVQDTLDNIKRNSTLAGYNLDKDSFVSKPPEKYEEKESTTLPPEEDKLPVALYIIIAVAAAGLLIVVILGTCNCVRTSRNKKQQAAEDDRRLIQNGNGDNHGNGVSKMSYDDWVKQQQMHQSYDNHGYQQPSDIEKHTSTMTFTEEIESFNSKL